MTRLKKNTRLIGSGRLSSAAFASGNIDVYINEKKGVVKRTYVPKKRTVTIEGRVSFAEDFFDLGFTKAERRLTLKAVDNGE